MFNSNPQENRGYRHPFLFGVHYLGGVGDAPRTLAEMAMSHFSARIRKAPEWWKFHQDAQFRVAWTKIGLEHTWIVKTPNSSEGVDLSLKQANYVLDELSGYASLRDEKHHCQVSAFERIWESDSLLNPEQSEALRSQLLALRIEDTRIQMVDLIDPSSYCLVYHRTLVSHLNGRIYKTVPPPPSPDIYTVSSELALLPSDVWVSDAGPTAKFVSYINDLDPTVHQPTYDSLQRLLSKFIPLFEHMLTDLHRNNPLVQRIPGVCKYTVWDEPEAPDHSDDEEGWVDYEKNMREWAFNRPIDLPDTPPTGYPGNLEKRRHVVRLRDRLIQVIVRASTIRLVPEGPNFPETAWHVEGMRNERIVASGFHCISLDNIAEASIQFRMAVTYPRGFSAGDNGATIRTWGLRDGNSCHQYIADVPIRQGLSLVFPNIYQHRQGELQLADRRREGRIMIIWFYLIDPEIQPVVSTSLVAPQAKEWIRKALDDHLDKRLPHEIIENIVDQVHGLMTQDEAQAYRNRMKEIRAQFTEDNNSYHFCIPFDIWNGPEMIP